ncbi:DUF4369 domain-containing protein [Lutibacter sp.]
MKKILIFCFCSIFISSCNKPHKSLQKKENNQKNSHKSFVITGKVKNFYTNTVYLNKIDEYTISPVDSSLILNNTFTFKGTVEYPERYALTFKNYPETIVFIIENKDFTMHIDQEHAHDFYVEGSPLNTKLNEYKTASKKLFSKIEDLFPEFQKARLENDVKTLNKIETQIKTIETEFTNFSYQFIENHKNSYLSAMLLRDLLKSSLADTSKIKNNYNLLPENIKKAPDAQKIAAALHIR